MQNITDVLRTKELVSKEAIKNKPWIKMVLVYLLVLALLVALISGISNNSKTSNEPTTVKKENKSVSFKSKDGKVTGVIGMMPYSKNPKYVLAVYNIKINDTLAENWTCKGDNPSMCSKTTEYSYAINLKEAQNDSNNGTISTVQCKKDWFFTNPYTLDSRDYEFSKCFNSLPISQRVTKPTDVFYAWFTKSYKDYGEYKANTQLELYDLQKYWYMSEKKENSQTWSTDIARAMKETKPVVTYEIVFEN